MAGYILSPGHEAGLPNRDKIDKGGWSPTLSIMNDPMAYASHISQLANHLIDRSVTLSRAPNAPLTGRSEKLGPLLDVAAKVS